MHSMTGYGKAEYNQDGINLVIELKTVNNRFLDLVPKYPRVLLKFDDLIRKTVSAHLSRGRVELFITLKDTRESFKSFTPDIQLAKRYYDAYLTLKQNFGDLEDDLTLSSLIRVPDVLTETSDGDDSCYGEILSNTLVEALNSLNAMRKVEGEKLKLDLLNRVNEIAKILSTIRERAPEIAKDYQKRLTDRVAEAMQGVDIDQARLLQEVAIFADKSNIDEEMTRLESHIEQFKAIVESENAGRKLDFLVQEFNREANTICSKSNDIIITDCGLKLKCEIEKIREQIQNIE